MLWGIRPVEPQAAHNLAVDLLRRQIHTGLLLPAEKLPAERQLSDRFGISRVTLREALRVLETTHYITVRRGAQGGAFVSDADRLRELARRHMTSAPATAMRTLEFLAVNLEAAAGHAAVRRGPADLKRLRDAADMLACAATAAHRKQAEALFFLAIGDASQNALMARAVEDGLATLFLPFDQAGSAGGADAARVETFGRLRDAITGERSDEAASVTRELLADLWTLVRRTVRNAA